MRRRAKFLLIGDGTHKPHARPRRSTRDSCRSRASSVGRVPQDEGARLLGACDIFVSPHNSHMVDSRFFGSPTKLFEYMAMGGGIVASDLEQIGEVLSPALRADGSARRDAPVGDAARGAVHARRRRGVRRRRRRSRRAAGRSRDALGRNARAGGRTTTIRGSGTSTRSVGFIAAALRPQPDVALRRRSLSNRRRLQGRGAAPVEQQSGRLRTTSRRRAPHTLRVVPGSRSAPLRRVRAVDARGDGVRRARRRGRARNRRRHRHRSRAVRAARRPRHRCRSVARPPRSWRRRTSRCAGLPGASCITTPRRCRSTTTRSISSTATASFTTRRIPRRVVEEIFRVLKPGGRVIVMVYAENSLHYWRNLIWHWVSSATCSTRFDGRHHVALRRDHAERCPAAGQGLHRRAAAQAVRRLRAACSLQAADDGAELPRNG